MLVLAICCLSLFIFGVDSTIVNVALPSIQHELHAPVSGLQWTVDAYTVVMASFVILAGSTADRLGRRRIFQVGLATFTLGSLLCSLAPGLGWLVVFRMLQAVGGSMMNPVAVSIIANTFADPRERARAIGVWGGVFGLSIALGPVLGGVLTDSVGWRGIFWVNIPVGRARPFGPARRAVPPSAGGEDAAAGAAVGVDHRPPGAAAAAAGGRGGDDRRRPAADRPAPRHSRRLAHDRLSDVRHRVRPGEPSDHEHRRVRPAPRPGRRGRGRGLDQPSGRPVPGPRGGGRGRIVRPA